MKKPVPLPTEDVPGGYVLIAIRSGFKSNHVFGRYTAAVLEEAQIQWRSEDPSIVDFHVEAACDFSARNLEDFRRDRGRLSYFHDDWDYPINPWDWPLRDCVAKPEEATA
jgi:hypothetical protein